MKNLITLSLLILSYSTIAQIIDKHDYIWIMGSDIDVSIPGGQGNLFDFNDDTLEVSYLVKDMNLRVTNASISDTAGNLLFYSNGCYIADATHEMMENGDQINYPGWTYDNNCPNDDGYTVSQGAMILPQPDSTDIYYLFHTKKTLMEIPPFNFDLLGTPFLYTKVDMSKNNGLGAVVEKNQVVLGDTLQPSHLTAVRHANGNDWWIVMTKQFSDLYYKILFTADGVDSIQTQNVGMPEMLDSRGGGQSVFSPDGSKYARYDPASEVFLFDFNRGTGELSNFQNLIALDTAVGAIGGIAFSPNNRFLYISANLFLFQFDLEASNIQASRVLIGTYDGFLDPFITNFWKMQLAPDCRIYMNSTSGVSSMHVIQHPDRQGLDCDFQQHSLVLPSNNGFGFPNFPNYRLGVTPTYPCDSTIAFQTLVAIDDVLAEKNEVKLFPNPTRDIIHLELEKGIEGKIVFYNMMGQQVFQQYIYKNERQYEWSLDNLETGIYFYSIISEGRLVGSGKVVKVE